MPETDKDILGGSIDPLNDNRQFPAGSPKKFNPALILFFLAALAAAGVYFGPQYRDYLDAREAVIGYMIAVRDMDGKTMKELSSRKALEEMEKAGGLTKEKLALIKAFHPPSGRLLDIKITGNKAAAILTADAEEFKSASGIVKMIRENNEWKVEKVDWKIQLGAGGAYNSAKSIRMAGFIPAPPVKKIKEELYSEQDFFVPSYDVKYRIGASKPAMLNEIDGLDNPVMEFSPDGTKMLAAGYGNYIVKLYETSGWTVLKEFKMQHRPVSVAAFLDFFIISDAYGGFTRVNTLFGSGEPSRVTTDGSTQPHIYASQNLKYLASVSFGKKFSVYDAKTLEPVSVNTLFMPPLYSGAFWPNGPYFFCGMDSQWFMIWDLAAGKGRSYHIPKVTKSVVTSISFSPDGKYFITTHNDSSIVLFETETQKMLRNYYVRDKGAMASAFSPDGKFYATSNGQGWMYFWSCPEAQQLAAFQMHDDMILSVKFIPGKAQMATAGNDHKIRIWDLQ